MFLMLMGPLLLIHFFYVLAVIKKNLSVIDTCWGLGFVVLSILGCIESQFHNFRENILGLLTLIWGLRLAVFLHLRNHGKPEDFRYAAWRKEWGEKTNLIAYVKVYWLQYILMLVVALPLFGAHHEADQSLSLINILGLIFWILGFSWEVIADQQKSIFKNRPENKNKFISTGLWKFSRHPNYFGEALLWWGVGLTAFNGSNLWVLIGPLFLNFLLLKVSGVPMLEKRYKGYAHYEQYALETPTLIPSLKKIIVSMTQKKVN
jgi:steroid 5-alpha reductase family enzyme